MGDILPSWDRTFQAMKQSGGVSVNSWQLKGYRLSSFPQQELSIVLGHSSLNGLLLHLLKLPELSTSSKKSCKAKPNNLQSERTLLIRRNPVWGSGASEEGSAYHKRSQQHSVFCEQNRHEACRAAQSTCKVIHLLRAAPGRPWLHIESGFWHYT